MPARPSRCVSESEREWNQDSDRRYFKNNGNFHSCPLPFLPNNTASKIPPRIPRLWQVFFCSGSFSLSLSPAFFCFCFQKFDLTYLLLSVEISKSSSVSAISQFPLLHSYEPGKILQINIFLYAVLQYLCQIAAAAVFHLLCRIQKNF